MPIDPNALTSTASLTFDDEFNSFNLWNGTSGTWSTNFWYAADGGSSLASNGEEQWYIDASYAATSLIKPWSAQNGVLDLTAAKTPQWLSGLVHGYEYTSGEINSYHSFSQTYGYFEMRAKLPEGQGLWPAFWLMPTDGSWPPELDAMEVLGSNPNELYTTVHSQSSGTHTAQGIGTNVADMSAGFHSYGVDWEPDYITWYFDGQQVYRVQTPADLNKPMYMIANLAVGGYWGGMADDDQVFPAKMQIDYIRAYSSMPAGTQITAPTSETPSVSAPAANGQVLTSSSDSGSVLTGGAGDDTLIAGYGADVMTGGAGKDVFQFAHLPWNAGHITDFTPGTDTIDLSALFAATGYQGSDPVADGYLRFDSDGNGGTKIYFDSDGTGTGNPWPFLVTTLDHVAPSSLTAGSDWTFGATQISQPSPPAGNSGSAATTPPAESQALIADLYAATTLTGGAGNDTLIAGYNADTLTGGAGNDVFQFDHLPWNAGHVTDFTPGADMLDLRGLLTSAGYTGSNPVQDGYVSFASDGAGGTKVFFDPDGPGSANPWPYLVTTLDHVQPASLQNLSDWQFHTQPVQTAAATPSVQGQVLTSDLYSPTVLSGGAANDTLIAGFNADTLTGGAGSDIFQFDHAPWNAGHVTDFTSGEDALDLRGLLNAAGYHGSDPLHDGYVSFVADGAGGTKVYFDSDGTGSVNPWPVLVSTLDHVQPSSLHMQSDWLIR